MTAPRPDDPDRHTWTRTWDRPGDHTVSVEAFDQEGARSVGRATVHVLNRPPTASFSLPEHVPTGTFVTPLDDSSDPDGRVVRWHWQWGGQSIADPRPRISWDAPGNHTVALMVEDNHGAVSQRVEATVVVENRPPVAHITSFWDAGRGEHVVADASVDPDGNVTGRHWTVDGVAVQPNPPGTPLRLPGPGTFRVDLRVVDDQGAASTATRYLAPPTIAVGTVPTVEGTLEPERRHDDGTVRSPERSDDVLLLAWIQDHPRSALGILAASAVAVAAGVATWVTRSEPIRQKDDVA